jgi:23S rRNA pseudouridine1911/1915/1917 synthase
MAQAVRTFVITRAERGRSVAEVLHARLGLSFNDARRLINRGHVRLDGRMSVDPRRTVRAGQQVKVAKVPAAAARKPAVPPPEESLPRTTIRYADLQVIIVEKPAGLTTVRHADEATAYGARARRYLPPTLADLLPGLLNKGRGGTRPVRAVHRLDKETSGLVVFARTPAAERDLGLQLRAHSMERRYLALVRGRARSERIETFLVEDRGDGRRGSATQPGEGKRAVTHVKVLENLGDFTLVECRLETGRTHQVRIHLGERGTPLCGEKVYDRPLNGRPLPDGSGADRPMLHAAGIGFRHPATGKMMSWTSPLPRDMARLLASLRKRAPADAKRAERTKGTSTV